MLCPVICELMSLIVFVCIEKREFAKSLGRKTYQRVNEIVIPKNKKMKNESALPCSFIRIFSYCILRSFSSSIFIVPYIIGAQANTVRNTITKLACGLKTQ